MIMKLAFVNADHERIYNEAKAMLKAECQRQKTEWERLDGEWERYPPHIRTEKRSWLYNHFAECRKPYEKILTDIVALCPTVTTIQMPLAHA